MSTLKEWNGSAHVGDRKKKKKKRRREDEEGVGGRQREVGWHLPRLALRRLPACLCESCRVARAFHQVAPVCVASLD